MSAVELVIIDRGGVRLGVPSRHVAEIARLPAAERGARLQQRLGQPPIADDERCFGLRVEATSGVTVVAVAGQVSVASVAAEDIAPLPPLLAGVAPVTAVVFGEELGGEAPVLVLDVDAMVEHARADR